MLEHDTNIELHSKTCQENIIPFSKPDCLAIYQIIKPSNKFPLKTPALNHFGEFHTLNVEIELPAFHYTAYRLVPMATGPRK
jgi:hypothetical protein